jgi:prevent-host-death family protein
VTLADERTMSVGQLRQNPAPMVHDVESGHEWVLTNHGRPFGRVVPFAERQWVAIGHAVDVLNEPEATGWAEELTRDREGSDMADPWS